MSGVTSTAVTFCKYCEKEIEGTVYGIGYEYPLCKSCRDKAKESQEWGNDYW